MVDKHETAGLEMKMSSRTMFISQEAPANALALNKDNTQVVIAGRNVFKIFTIKEEEFEETCNLRVGKNLNLNFSCNDVAWNAAEDHILATAATNGAVVVWNLNRPSRSKQDHVFIDHKRTVNKVSFHPAESNWLISGSQDGTMKCFDLRTRETARTYHSNTESVRDVQFSPHIHHMFAAVSENGNVQLWDIRRPDRCCHQFTAHSGPVFACDWHPEVSWLATASRDKTIKVWNLNAKPTLEHTVPTIASVGHIKWRPQRKFHIASCALVVDCSINVWDVRRPYIPYAAFNEHKDVATDVAWCGNPHTFVSTSRDCTLYHHIFQDATRPANRANPQSVAFNKCGDVSYACKVNVNQNYGGKQGGVRKVVPHSEQFYQASSNMFMFNNNSIRETHWFCESARRYILTGRSLVEMCEHNAAVAKSLGRTNVSVVWNLVKTLYASSDQLQPPLPVGCNVSRDESVLSVDMVDGDQRTETPTVVTVPQASGDDETETDETPDLPRRAAFSALTPSQGDFFFGEGELALLDFEQMTNNAMVGQQDWTLPNEAFQVRHEIQDRSPPPEQFPNHSPTENLDGVLGPLLPEESSGHPVLSVPNVPRPQPLDPTAIVVDALRHHAELGDVQTAVCVLAVLGDRIRRQLSSLLTTVEQETWLLGYLDSLSRRRQWIASAHLTQLSWISAVSRASQRSTTVYSSCSTCRKPLQRAGWLCDRCGRRPAACAVCHRTVRGLYAWCQGCAHGGHIMPCLQKWWENDDRRECPAGCGHICQYN